ncbi:MAG: epimerase [Candidatus Marinimicrobia bacterium]|nr:epimerase [Candidatus Neomarinimicrobiota bacterium]|tara:strand:- start:2037 stop:2975 length:939 start_codon:yes stop_codon:yes gene_type:complete
MKVAVFGGTGYVGSYITDELIAQGHTPRLMVRVGSERKVQQPEKCEIISGQINEEETIRSVISGTDAVIYLIAVLREFPKKGITWEDLHFKGAKACIDFAKELGGKRFILMSANGVKPDGTGYQSTKFLADEYLKASGLDYTIFRPTSLFGDPRGENRPEFCTQILKDMLRLPIPAPLFHHGFIPRNAGGFEFNPIHVSDVARIFVEGIEKTEMIGQIYELGGFDNVSWKSMIKIVSKAAGKKKWSIPAPVMVVKALATLLDRFSWFPVTRAQLTMLMEDNTCNSENLFQTLKMEPKTFNVEALEYLQSKDD